MKKETRLQILNKYNSHCAYCGKPITYKEMQVDHLIPQKRGGTNDLENLMPSCRRCNHYKRAHTLELFRDILKSIHTRLSKIYIFKVAMDYGIVQIKPFDGVFYFEKGVGKKCKHCIHLQSDMNIGLYCSNPKTPNLNINVGWDTVACKEFNEMEPPADVVWARRNNIS